MWYTEWNINKWKINELQSDDMIIDKDPEMLEEENQRLKKQLLCLKCEKAERVMVFIPCGHRLVCKACSDKMRKCIQCKKKIQKKVKTYLCWSGLRLC